MKNRFGKLLLGALMAFAISATFAHAQGTFSASATQPTFDGADQGYFADPGPGSHDDKWWTDTVGHGQTFTLTGDVLLSSVTLRLSTTRARPTKVYILRLGAVDTATGTFYELHSEEITQDGEWNFDPEDPDDPAPSPYGTWTLDEPVALPGLPAGVVYGFDLTMKSSSTAWQSGIPYPRRANTDVFAGGARYTVSRVGNEPHPTSISIAGSTDREFHIGMTATTIEDTTAPNLVSIEDQVGGGPIYEDQVWVTYILSFDKAIDESTIDLSVFENLGTGVSLDSIVSLKNTPFPAASTVEVIFQVSGTGTLQLGIKDDAEIKDYYDNALAVPVSDDVTITVNDGLTPSSGVRYWDGPNADGVGDGMSDGGNGNWNTVTNNWDQAFGIKRMAWDNTNDDVAVFGGTANTTVTVEADITLGGLVISNANTTTFNGDFTFNFADGGSIIHNASGNRTATINQAITNAPSVTIAAGERLTFNSGSRTQTLGNIFVNPRQDGTADNIITLRGTSTANTAGNIIQTTGNNQQRTSLEKRDAGTWTVGDVLGQHNARLRLFLFDAGRLVVTGDITSTEFLFQSADTTLELRGDGELTTASSVINPLRGTIDNNSGGPVTFIGNPGITFAGDFTLARHSLNMGTGNTNLGTAVRSITVEDETSTLTFGGIVSNTGGITKLGDGILELTGANTYSGATTVSTGTLALVGGSQASAITVEDGAKLGFTLGSPTTSSASVTLDGGHGIVITGTVDGESDYPLMAADGGFTGDPALLGVFMDYSLQLRAGGTELWLALDTGVSPYDDWANGNAFDADGSGDGIPNGVAWVLGAADPTENVRDEGLLPTIEADGDLVSFTFRRLKAANDDPNTGIEVEYSTDLAGAWDVADDAEDGIEIDVDGTNPDVDIVTVTFDKTELGIGDRLFVRLRVEQL